MKVPPFADFGKTCSELLYGGVRSGGVYQFDSRCKISGKASDGLSVDVTTKRSHADGAVDMDVKGTLKCCKEFTVEGVATSASKASVKATVSNVIDPGFKAVASASFPYKSPAKVAMEYGHPHFHVKGTASMAKMPEVALMASAGVCGGVVGGNVAYDTSRKECSAWSLAAGYTHPTNHSVFAYMLKKGQAVKVTYSYQMSDRAVVGGEVIKPLKNGGDMTASLGYSRRLDSGALAKGKVSSEGICSLLWESMLPGDTKVALSGQFDANSLEKNARVGMSMEIGK